MPALLVPVISAIGAAIGSTFGAALVMYATQIATGLMLIGTLSMSANAKRKAERQARAQYNAAQVDRLVNTSGTNEPRMLILGTVTVGGFVAFRESTGTNREKFILILVLAGHELDGIVQYNLNDTPVTLDVNGYVLTEPYALSKTETAKKQYAAGGTVITLDFDPLPGSISVTAKEDLSDRGRTRTVNLPFSVAGRVITLTAGAWVPPNLLSSVAPLVTYQYTQVTPKVRITAHLGTAGQVADAQTMSDFPGVWTAAHIGNGIPYLRCEFLYDETAFPSGLPNITVKVRGAKMYDPRTGLTVWSENPAIMQRHVLLHPYFGRRTSLTAGEEARIIAAANACDIQHNYGEGLVPMFRASLAVPYGTPAIDALEDLTSAMGGLGAHATGQFYIRAGVYSAPVLSLNETDVATIRRESNSSLTRQSIGINPHEQRVDKFNTVIPKIWDQAQGGKLVPLTAVTSTALKTRDGQELSHELLLAAVGYAQQAQHLSGMLIRDSRDPLMTSIPFKLKAYRVELFDVISLTIPKYGWVAKSFMVLGRHWSVEGGLMLTLKETAAAIYQPDAAFIASGYAPNTNLISPWDITPPTINYIGSGTGELVLQADGTVLTRVRVGWVPITDTQILQGGAVEIQWAKLGGTEIKWSSLTANPYETSAYITDAADGESLVIRSRTRSSIASSDWSLQQVHNVVGQTEPPPPFDVFNIMVQPDGTRQFNFGYTTTNEPVDWLGGEIRYLAGTHATPNWDLMTPLQDDHTYYAASPVERNAPLEGVWTFACKSSDRSRNLSTALVRNITLSRRRSGSTYQEVANDITWPGVKTSLVKVGDVLEAESTTTWDSDTSDWSVDMDWAFSPAASGSYITPHLDLETAIAGQIDATVVALGTVTIELSTSDDNSIWSAWVSASEVFNARWVRLRITITATVPEPLATLISLDWRVSAEIKREYLNDIVPSTLAGLYRIGVGDVRAPIEKTYIGIRVATATVQDNRSGAWSVTRLDKDTVTGPRFKFYLSGVLTDPQFVDFDIEGI